MTPMPPSCAIAIARRASVTVSMAAETTGRLRTMFRLRWVLRLVARGNTWEYAGTNNTSATGSALPRRRIEEAPDAKADYTDSATPCSTGVHETPCAHPAMRGFVCDLSPLQSTTVRGGAAEDRRMSTRRRGATLVPYTPCARS